MSGQEKTNKKNFQIIRHPWFMHSILEQGPSKIFVCGRLQTKKLHLHVVANEKFLMHCNFQGGPHLLILSEWSLRSKYVVGNVQINIQILLKKKRLGNSLTTISICCLMLYYIFYWKCGDYQKYLIRHVSKFIPWLQILTLKKNSYILVLCMGYAK